AQFRINQFPINLLPPFVFLPLTLRLILQKLLLWRKHKIIGEPQTTFFDKLNRPDIEAHANELRNVFIRVIMKIITARPAPGENFFEKSFPAPTLLAGTRHPKTFELGDRPGV
ncbi:MAG: hypothetical protein LWY06_06105, partial [Firmicutes bacterium]|nr:hypothetical protein [Bacillota bacterium]